MVTDNRGATIGDRTRGLRLTKTALVPLSYGGSVRHYPRSRAEGRPGPACCCDLSGLSPKPDSNRRHAQYKCAALARLSYRGEVVTDERAGL